MSATCGQLIDDVLGGLQGYSLDEEQSTTLAADIGPGDLTFTVTTTRSTSTGISTGIIEMGQELLFCETVTDSGCDIAAWGRGYRSTTAAAHPAGTRIVSQPSFPRSKVLDAINQVLERIFPSVWAVKSFESTTTVPQMTYDIPDDAQRVLTAKWLVPDGTGYWKTLRHWRMGAGGGTLAGDGLNGVTVDVGDFVIPGQPIQFLYAAKPSPLVNETDDFAAVTGLGLGLRDVVTLGATVQLTPAQELSRLQTASVEQQTRNQTVAPAAALTSTRFLEQRFQTRLLEERRTLQELYPPRVTGGWL